MPSRSIPTADPRRTVDVDWRSGTVRVTTSDTNSPFVWPRSYDDSGTPTYAESGGPHDGFSAELDVAGIDRLIAALTEARTVVFGQAADEPAQCPRWRPPTVTTPAPGTWTYTNAGCDACRQSGICNCTLGNRVVVTCGGGTNAAR